MRGLSALVGLERRLRSRRGSELERGPGAAGNDRERQTGDQMYFT